MGLFSETLQSSVFPTFLLLLGLRFLFRTAAAAIGAIRHGDAVNTAIVKVTVYVHIIIFTLNKQATKLTNRLSAVVPITVGSNMQVTMQTKIQKRKITYRGAFSLAIEATQLDL